MSDWISKGLQSMKPLRPLSGCALRCERRASFLRSEHLQLASALYRAFFGSTFCHRISDAEISKNAQGRSAIETSLRPDLFVESIDFGQFDSNLLAVIFRHFVAGKRLQTAILLCCAARQHQRCNKRSGQNSHIYPQHYRVDHLCHILVLSAKPDQVIGRSPFSPANIMGDVTMMIRSCL